MAAQSRSRVAGVRRFNRFYTQKIGVLGERLYDSDYSLTEVRILYELAHHKRCTAAVLCRDLDLDAGYVSRVLRDFKRRGFVQRRRSESDRRASEITLTAKGREAFAPLDAASRRRIAQLLGGLPEAKQKRLLDAMATVESLLGAQPSAKHEVVLRTHRAGDIGWVIQRHGVLYAQEQGWGAGFEALVAEIAARFLRQLDPARERCWIAELDGEPVGSVFLVRSAESERVAQLRLLLVEPHARGHGIGDRLVQACIDFARACGYESMMLWTNDVLHAARHIYLAKGFRLVREERHRQFGDEQVGQHWALAL